MNNTASQGEKTRLGIDVGGTQTKIAVVCEDRIIHKYSINTASVREEIIADIIEEYNKMKEEYDVSSVGICIAGSVVDDLVDTSNLPFHNYNLKAELKERIPCLAGIENDANAAALAEAKYGLCESRKSLVLMTLGTGIGGGIILDGKLRSGRTGCFGEIGHMIVQAVGGEKCVCGQSGCLERYASTSALIRNAQKACLENKESILYEKYALNGSLSGQDIFQAMDEGCPIAKKVFDNYTDYLAAGIDSVVNAYDPDAFVLTGGITGQGEKLLAPLKAKLNSKIEIRISKLQGDAGALGATLLGMEA